MTRSSENSWPTALAWLCGQEAEAAFALPPAAAPGPAPAAADLERVLAAARSAGLGPENARRMVNMAYALAAVLLAQPALRWPAQAGQLMAALYPTRAAKEPLLAVLDQLTALRQSCDALPGGSFRLVEAQGDRLHFIRTGQTETLHCIANRGPHLLVAKVGEKATQVNPFGFTITVEELGHDPNHSYYDVS